MGQDTGQRQRMIPAILAHLRKRGMSNWTVQTKQVQDLVAIDAHKKIVTVDPSFAKQSHVSQKYIDSIIDFVLTFQKQTMKIIVKVN